MTGTECLNPRSPATKQTHLPKMAVTTLRLMLPPKPPPPHPNSSPETDDGRWRRRRRPHRTAPARWSQVAALFLFILSSRSSAETIVKEKVISNKQTWTAAESPFVVRHDILVESGGELTIEPGVDVRFSPEVGITVRGVLVADGLEDRKIRDGRECLLSPISITLHMITTCSTAWNESIGEMHYQHRG